MRPLVLASVLLWGASGGAAPAQDGPATVTTDRVAQRAVSETVSVFGQVVATRESDVAMRVAGVVADMPIFVGTRLDAGDVVAVLDREVLRLELRSKRAAMAEAEAGVAVAQAALTLAQRAFARVEGLRGTSAFSQGQFDDRESAVAQARGGLAQAQARLMNAEAAADRAAYDMERAVLRAPFPGTVLEVMVDPGEYVQVGQPVARVVNIDALEIEANVPAAYIDALSPGLALRGVRADGTPLPLTVRAVLPTEFSATRTRPVRLTGDLGALDGQIAVGQTLTLEVPRDAPRDVLLVPKDAVTQAQGAWSVFVHADGKAVPREITIGDSFGDRFEVLSGLDAGDEVVVRGNERLRPMQPIAPQPIRDDSAAADDPDAQARLTTN